MDSDSKDLPSMTWAQVEGDGACFPRAISLWLFGTQDFFLHIRLFCVANTFMHRVSYLSWQGWSQVAISPPRSLPPQNFSSNWSDALAIQSPVFCKFCFAFLGNSPLSEYP
jgi:hypothetical protein